MFFDLLFAIDFLLLFALDFILEVLVDEFLAFEDEALLPLILLGLLFLPLLIFLLILLFWSFDVLVFLEHCFVQHKPIIKTLKRIRITYPAM